MDASRYKKHHECLMEEQENQPMLQSQSPDYVRMLWQKLLDAYIIPNGPREVNLPSRVRDQLLSQPNHTTPPCPAVLDAAVKVVYELMDESVFVPFLNSVAQVQMPNTSMSPWTSSDNFSSYSGSRESRSLSPGGAAPKDQSPTTSSLSSFSNFSRPFLLPQRSHLSDALRRSTHNSNHSASSGEAGMTEDASNTDSPASFEPMTPPITPPTSDLPDEESGWKKMGAKLGLRRSKTGRRGDTSSSSLMSMPDGGWRIKGTASEGDIR